MASEAKPPILAAPLEIRFEIYRHTWSISDSDARERFERIIGQHEFSRLSEFYYFRLQVKQLHTLVSICRQIRDEVLSEYFHQTHVVFSNRLTFRAPPLGRRLSFCIAQDIQSSLLFASYTQHFSIRWAIDKETTALISTLDWLLQLKRLKTLELVIRWTLPPHLRSIPYDIFDFSLFQRLTPLRNLEKIILKLDGDSLEQTTEAQRIQDILSKSVREDLRQPKQQPTYVFENLIGSNDDIAWPLPHRI